jgi:hypothetical protein
MQVGADLVERDRFHRTSAIRSDPGNEIRRPGRKVCDTSRQRLGNESRLIAHLVGLTSTEGVALSTSGLEERSSLVDVTT